jgi:hypothetical protein
VELKGDEDIGPLWCKAKFNQALQEQPCGTYRRIIFDWALGKSGSEVTASEVVKLTLLSHLKSACISKKGAWQPNAEEPHNKSLRWAFYYSVASLLSWTERRAVLNAEFGDGDPEDGFSAAFHEAANNLWPGLEYDPPVPLFD